MSRKVDQLLDLMERKNGLSPDGRSWLIAACDPFHDADISLAGYPDVNSSATVVQLVKKQLQISVPTTGNGTVTNGSNWDCSIALYPTLNSSNYVYTATISAFGATNTTSAANGFYAGALAVSAGPQGAQLWPSANPANQGNGTTSGLSCSEYAKGTGRIIGMAFEVVNTTAEINKQGQVTVWRLPNSMSETCTQVSTTPATQYSSLNYRLPPADIADAQLLYGSRSWAAKEGCYIVARQNTSSNPMLQPSHRNLYFTPADADYTSGQPIQIYTTQNWGNSMADYYCPFDLSGAHFTGLSYNTTLTVNVRWLIERTPGPAESDLVVMASPSAPYDPLALELYVRCLRDMPPGVMLSENPLGEWFKKAIGAVAKFAPTIGDALGAVGVPMASTIGKVVGKGAGLAHAALQRSSEKKKGAPRPPPLPPRPKPKPTLAGSASTTRSTK